MNDLTIVMLTPNKVPKKWAEYHKEKLLEAADGADIITVANEKLDWGTHNLIQEEYSIENIYKQMLRAFTLAKTEFVAMADDDTLYHSSHFKKRPEEGKFYYNHNRWHLFTWGNPFYFYKPRSGNGLLIAHRDLAIKALTNRFATRTVKKRGLIGWFSKELGTKVQARKYDIGEADHFYTTIPVVSFYHQESFDLLNQKRKKVPWPVQVKHLPYWGWAKHLRRRFV